MSERELAEAIIASGDWIDLKRLCSTCGGSGGVQIDVTIPDGQAVFDECSDCEGEGYV